MDDAKKPAKKYPKFVGKYAPAGVITTSQGYKTTDTSIFKIGGPGHALHDQDGHTTFDEAIVREIDKDGAFIGDVIVWTNPDTSEMFVMEGRGNVFNVAEVNRRRAERGDALVEIHFKPFPGSLERAAEHVRLRNYHRTTAGVGRLARDVVELVLRQGKTWARAAEILHLDPEKWTEAELRYLAPVAHCVPEVVAAIEAGKVRVRAARRFGGRALDGSLRLGRDEQLALLGEMLAPKPAPARPPAGMPRAAQGRVLAALQNGAIQKIREQSDRVAAVVARGVLARLAGDASALADFPELAAIFDAPPEAAKT